jgi:chromosome segregation ATPase
MSGLNSQLQELERSNSILNHKLADQEAAIELEMKKRTALQQENGKLREENAVFKKQEEQWSTHFQALHRSTKDVEKMLLQSLTNLNKTVSKLASFDQRLKFAGSRIQFISGMVCWWYND